MKAIQVKKAGSPEVLEYVSLPIPKVKLGWTLVKVLGFGINRSEIFTRKGLSPNVEFPRVLGIECVGIVIESSSLNFLPGQKVVSIMGEMGRNFDGSYAEYVLIPDEQVYPVESSLTLDELISLPETFYTAFGSLKNLHINLFDSILVRGATSGVGVAFAKLVKAKFPSVSLVGSTRSLEKKKQLIDNGFDDVIIDTEGNLATQKCFSKILELVGPSTIKNSIFHLEEQGIICSTGQLGGQWYIEDFDPIEQLSNNIYLTTFYSGNVSQHKIQEMIDFIEKYKVDTSPEKIYKFDEVKEAHRYLEDSKSFGKVIIKVSDGK